MDLEVMDLEFFAQRFTENQRAIEALVAGTTREQACWRPAPGKWSLLEILHHLLDEERSDFRIRLDLLLHQPEEEWPGMDPEGWVTERDYNSADLATVLADFLREREQSVSWLRGLRDPHWAAVKERPHGSLTAGDLLSSWLAHDYLHIRQLARVHYDYVVRVSAPYKPDYAGPLT